MIKTTTILGLLCILLINFTFRTFAQVPDTWTQKNNFTGFARYGTASFSIGAKGYMGTGNTGANSKDFWEYDPTTDSWSQKANFGGSARVFAVGFSIGTKGYIGTGFADVTTRFADFWEYDAISNTWTQKANFGGLARSNAVGFSIGSKGYIGTGLIDGTTRTNDFWEYDQASDIWTQKSNVGGPVRASAAGFSIGNKGYVGTGNSGMLQKDFWEYDPTTDVWVQKANFAGVARFQGIGKSTRAFGYIGLGDIGGGYSTDFWEYNPALDTWTQKTSFGGDARALASSFSISNTIYVGTGYDALTSFRYKDFWEYTPSCKIPIITSEPGNQSLIYGSSARFIVTATDAVSYQWQQDTGSGFFDIADGGIYLNTTNDTLDISLPTVEMTGYKYRCVITGDCSLNATSEGNATLTVAKMDVVITPDVNQSKEYSASDPVPFTFSPTPSLLGSDTFTGELERATGEDTGTYAFTSGTLSAGNNYNLTVANTPTFTITALPVVITPDADQTKTYGSADPALYAYKFSPPLLGTDIISGQMDRVSGENVGSYTFGPGTLTAGTNYSLTLASNPTFNITSVSLSITADDKEKCYDGAIYSDAYTVSYNGFVNGDDQNALAGTLVFGGTSATATLAGNYSVEPSGFTSSNYTIGFINGILVIKPIPNAPVISRSGDSLISSIANGNQWYLDGVEIAGSNDSVYVATSDGTYYTVVTEGGCSSDASNSISILNVSTNEISAELYDIYPNPNNGIFNIKTKTTGKEVYDIEIYNNLGTLIWKQKNSVIAGNDIKNIELRVPVSGVYTVILRNKANSFVKKLFITR
jgi:hypothetical protein